MAKSCCVMIRSLHGEQAQSITGRSWGYLACSVACRRPNRFHQARFRQSLPRARKLSRLSSIRLRKKTSTTCSVWDSTAPVYSNLGVVYLHSGKPDDAIRMLERAKELAPTVADIRLNLCSAAPSSRRSTHSPAEALPDDRPSRRDRRRRRRVRRLRHGRDSRIVPLSAPRLQYCRQAGRQATVGRRSTQ